MQQLLKNKLLLGLIPVFVFLIFLIYMLFATAQSSPVTVYQIDWHNLFDKAKYQNKQEFGFKSSDIKKLCPLSSAELKALSLFDGKSKFFMYSYSELSDGNKMLGLVDENKVIRGLIYSADNELLNEFELAAEGKSVDGNWQSYGRLTNNNQEYKLVRLLFQDRGNGKYVVSDSVVTRINTLIQYEN